MTAALMVQGAGSNVGKSLLVAGLCRVFARRGLTVRPFKPQNMSNNAAVTVEGGEIGRAQALQARACHAEPSVHMNPVLLKPESDTGAQVIVQGERFGSMKARDYGRRKAEFLPKVLDSFDRLKGVADLVLIEGAGSPAEVNLRRGDIANMGFAEAADVPVVLVGDIDRGGVIASLVGTARVLPPREAARIKGFLINKFRGERGLFSDGVAIIEAATGWPGLGIVPWFDAARLLPAEDILDLESRAGESRAGVKHGGAHDRGNERFHIAVPVLERIANFDDLDPLSADPMIRLTLVRAGEALPMDADLVLLPGSKSTIADLAFLREQGWDIDLAALRRQGRFIMGLCGGYQMLGRAVHDPQGLEGAPASAEGLGLLDCETTLLPQKTVRFVAGQAHGGGREMRPAAGWPAAGWPVSGYEIHLGETTGADTSRPRVTLGDGRADGAVSRDGRVMGCYMHGLFASDAYRGGWLGANLGASLGEGEAKSVLCFDDAIEDVLERLGDHLETHGDIAALARIAGLR